VWYTYCVTGAGKGLRDERRIGMIKRPSLSDVRRMVAAANGLTAAAVKVQWAREPKFVTTPTGVKAWFASATVAAPGFRTKVMLVNRDSTGTSVR
jgi:hypothetical protein